MVFTGTIYGLLINEYFYIGSTKASLERRLSNHISCSKNDKFNMKLYKHINEKENGNWDNVIMLTLETLECETLHDLYKKEYEYINKHISDPYCLNQIKDNKQQFAIIRYKTKK